MDIIFWIMIFVLIIVILVVTLMIIDIKKDKHFVEIREVVNGTKFLIKRKARDYVDEDGGNLWRLRGESDMMKRYLSIPPKESILIDNHGAKHVTIYRDENGAYTYQIDEVVSLGDDKLLQPLTTSQRTNYINNLKRANDRSNNYLAKNLPIIVGVAGVILLLAVALLFTPDVINSLQGKYTQMESMNKVLLEVVTRLDNMNNNIQIIGGGTGSNSFVTENSVPID